MIGMFGNKDARCGFFVAARGTAPQNVSPFKASPGFVADSRFATVDSAANVDPHLIPDPGSISGKRRDDHADTDKHRPPSDLTASDLDKDRPAGQQ